jgi:hypothetical protein
MLKTADAPTLSAEEIYNITHYRRTAEQLRALARLGIPAERRHDNTVCVLRAHLAAPATKPPAARPQLKL